MDRLMPAPLAAAAEIANPRTHGDCRYTYRREHVWELWRKEGWLLIFRCPVCGRGKTRVVRPRGERSCLVCKAPLPPRKRNWCGNRLCWMRASAYRNPSGWSRYIHRRFNGTCQDCGARGGRMEAHHVVPVGAGGIELDPDNGILLCSACHQRRHRRSAQ